MELPTRDRQLEYINAQIDQVAMQNFKSQIAEEITAERLKDAKKEGNKEAQRALEDEMENIDRSFKGNAKYLAVLKKFKKGK